MIPCATGAAACVDVELALAFADRVLSSQERALVEHRIDVCPRCRAIVAEAARMDLSMRGSPSATRGATRLERPSARTIHSPGASGTANVAASYAVESVLVAGEVVGRYIVERPLGIGGMGIVSLARDPELRRAVVIKLVRPDVADESSDDFETRLRREAQAMAQLSHPNVVQIFDIGRHGDRVFLAMEFVAGQTLDTWLLEKPRTHDEIVAMFVQAGAGLHAAHRAGLLHRDFKPSNVLVDQAGVVKVTDFGLARVLGPQARITRAMAAASAANIASTATLGGMLTHADMIIGTPAYMAPEQAAGGALDARTDQFAFALALLDALLGQHAVRRTVEPSDPARVDAALEQARVAPRVRQAIVRALREDPAQRFADLAALLVELAPERRERRWWPLAVAFGAVVLGIAAIIVWMALDRGSKVVVAESCLPTSQRAWVDGPRDRVRSAIAAQPRTFAAWHAEHVIAALDTAIAAIGKLEVADCERFGSGDRGSNADACVARRRQAIAVAVSALAAAKPPDNPWPLVRAIESCDGRPARADAANLRGELASADHAKARTIATRATEIADDVLRADALELAAQRAMASGHFDKAAEDLIAMAATGERTGDDSMRGRALLLLVELGRLRGDLVFAQTYAEQLGGLLQRHRDQPREVLTVVRVTAPAFVELGDVRAAFSAFDRAEAAARAIGSDDELLHVRALRARALQLMRYDAEAARKAIETALDGSSASEPARAAALAIAGELAIERGDGAAARFAFAKAHELDRSRVERDRLAVARALGLAGDVDAALAHVTAAPSGDPDPTSRIRAELARAKILLAAGRPVEAEAVFGELFRRFRADSVDPPVYGEPVGLSAYERIDALLVRCDVQLALGGSRSCVKPRILEKAHPKAPILARMYIQWAREYENTTTRTLLAVPLRNAIGVLEDASAERVLIAELKWRLAQIETEHGPDRKQHAEAARETFVAVGRTAEVAAIDAMLATLSVR